MQPRAIGREERMTQSDSPGNKVAGTADEGAQGNEDDERPSAEWSVSDPVSHSDYVPLDMAPNIDDSRTKQRVDWVDGFGRAYASALEVSR
jgi:hypothetical protein